MRVFINNIPIVFSQSTDIVDESDFNMVIDAANVDVTIEIMRHATLLKNIENQDIDYLVGQLLNKSLPDLTSIHLVVDNYEKAIQYFKENFKILKAAGGIVQKGEKFLMIYRLKKWDLPKGKLEDGETFEVAAVREVKEECGVDVKLGSEICTSWHTYTMHGEDILKQTKWYTMQCMDDRGMTPQAEEDIEEVSWLNREDVFAALKASYTSIVYVFDCFFERNDSSM